MSTMELHNAEIYGAELADQIAAQGRYTVDVANRWMLGWPSRVRAMLDAKVYFEWLKGQVCTEEDVLANEPSAQHLSDREILEMHKVQLAPPAMCDDPRFAAFVRGEVVVEELGGLPILNDRHRKDAEEVKAGLRSARSLVMFPEGWLKGATFTENPESEFNRPGEGR